MEDLIAQLQDEIYKVDFKIGLAADDLRKSDRRNHDSEINWYNECVSKRVKLLEAMEKLKQAI